MYELNFKPYPGLIVRCRKPSFGALDLLTEAVLDLGDDLSGELLPGRKRIKAWRTLFHAFADSLVSWTLFDRDRAVPATRDGVLAQDLEFLLAIVRTWYTVVVPDQPEPQRPPAPATAPAVDELELPTDFEDELAVLPVIDIAEDALVPA